jgi:hypothetical protein
LRYLDGLDQEGLTCPVLQAIAFQGDGTCRRRRRQAATRVARGRRRISRTTWTRRACTPTSTPSPTIRSVTSRTCSPSEITSTRTRIQSLNNHNVNSLIYSSKCELLFSSTQRASTTSRERAHSKCHHRSCSSACLVIARCVRSHRAANHGSHTANSMPATSGIKKTHSQRELPVARAVASPSPTDYCCVVHCNAPGAPTRHGWGAGLHGGVRR